MKRKRCKKRRKRKKKGNDEALVINDGTDGGQEKDAAKEGSEKGKDDDDEYNEDSDEFATSSSDARARPHRKDKEQDEEKAAEEEGNDGSKDLTAKSVQEEQEEVLRKRRLKEERDRMLEEAFFNKPVNWVMDQVKKEVHPSLQVLCVWLFRNKIYDMLSFFIILAIAFGLCAEGSLCLPITGKLDCFIDPLLSELVAYVNVFFSVDLIFQIICDGSISRHFKSGENVFNFIVNIFTSLSVILPPLGIPATNVAFIKGLAILRLLRATKYFFLKPIWLMFVKTTGSVIPVMNLIIFNFTITIVYYLIGRFLFGDTLNDDVRYNFRNFHLGYMTLFTVLTGDGWTAIMFTSMGKFCTGPSINDSCDSFKGTHFTCFTSKKVLNLCALLLQKTNTDAVRWPPGDSCKQLIATLSKCRRPSSSISCTGFTGRLCLSRCS